MYRKATGYDKIPGKLLRLAHNELSYPLASLINKCINKAVFPQVMKKAEVCPLYKKQDNLSKKNYRPVSVLTFLSKVYESIINDQMCVRFTDIFENMLCAFRRGYSCESLLTKCIDDWKVALDDKNSVGAIFMDLSKAFDCLPHSLLLANFMHMD